MVFSLAELLIVAGVVALASGAFGLWVGAVLTRPERPPRESFFLPHMGGQYGTSPIGKVSDTPPRRRTLIPGRPGQEVDSAGGALPCIPRLRPDFPPGRPGDYTE